MLLRRLQTHSDFAYCKGDPGKNNESLHLRIYGRYASYQLPINWSPTAVHGNVKDEERVSYASYVSAAVGPGLQVTNARPASRRYAVEYRYTWIA